MSLRVVPQWARPFRVEDQTTPNVHSPLDLLLVVFFIEFPPLSAATLFEKMSFSGMI